MYRVLRVLFVAFMVAAGGLSGGAAEATTASLFDLDCDKGERATGCMAPYLQCEVGVKKSVIATCQMSAAMQRCPDFGWEKCCAANCYLRAGKKTAKMGACMDECGSAAESSFFWPKAPASN